MKKCPSCGSHFGLEVQFCPQDGAKLLLQDGKGEPFIGRVIDGKYRLLEKLGGGGMGVVYLGEHTLMSRPVALKMLHENLLDPEDDEFRLRFEREAKTVSRIRHPNVVTVYDFGFEGRVPFLVMEYNEGKNLKTLLSEETPLPLTRVASIAFQMLDALSEAHALDIVHRDLKPENIMISPTREGADAVSVLDFGMSKALSTHDGDPTMTRSGVIVGTPKYMAPEQTQAQNVDSRADIYAVGAVLYEMLSGKPPFDGDSVMQLVLKHLTETPQPFREKCKNLNLPNSVEAVVMKALEKEPEKRFQSAAKMKVALKSALEGAESKAPKESRSFRVAFLFGVISLLCVLAFAVWNNPPRSPWASVKKTPAAVSASLPKTASHARIKDTPPPKKTKVPPAREPSLPLSNPQKQKSQAAVSIQPKTTPKPELHKTKPQESIWAKIVDSGVIESNASRQMMYDACLQVMKKYEVKVQERSRRHYRISGTTGGDLLSVEQLVEAHIRRRGKISVATITSKPTKQLIDWGRGRKEVRAISRLVVEKLEKKSN